MNKTKGNRAAGIITDSSSPHTTVIPAQAGIQDWTGGLYWFKRRDGAVMRRLKLVALLRIVARGSGFPLSRE